MRSFLSAMSIGSLPRPILARVAIPSRVQQLARASTSTQPGPQSSEAFASDPAAQLEATTTSTAAAPSGSPEELRRKAIRLYKEVSLALVPMTRGTFHLQFS